MVPPRTIRCANASLYAAMTLIVLAADAYFVFGRGRGTTPFLADHPLAAYIAAAAIALAVLVWGGYYVTLRYVVDAEGISRRLLGSNRRIRWADLVRAELQETRSQSVANLRLHLETADAAMELGSDLLSIDAVQDLARDLAAAHLLTYPLPGAEE